MSKYYKITISVIAIIIYNCLVYSLYVVESDFPDSNITNLADAYWYSLVTLTTVGYGDFYPVTFWGRFIGFLFVLGSLGILGYILTELNYKIKDYLNKKEMGLLGTKITNHYIIIGWNSFSKEVVEQIIRAKEPLAVIVNNEKDLKQIKQFYKNKECFVLQTEFEDHESLNVVNINNSKRVYINFDTDTETLVYAIGLKKRYNNLNCVVAIDNTELRDSFKYIGIQYIIPKKEIVSKFIASYIFEPNVASLTEDLISTSTKTGDFDICETELKEDSSLLNVAYIDAFVEQKKNNNITLLGVNRGGVLIKNPKESFLFEKGDIVVFIADIGNKSIFK